MRLRSAVLFSCLTAATSVAIFLTFSAPSAAHADDAAAERSCPTVDLTHDFNFGSPKSQKQLGWCFSYAAADVVSLELGRPVSSFDIALSVFRARTDFSKPHEAITELHGGNVFETFDAIKNVGVCDGTKFSSTHPMSAKILPKVEAFAEQMRALKMQGRLSELEVRRQVTVNSFNLHAIFPRTTLAEFYQIFTQLDVKQPALITLADAVCGQRQSIPNFRYGIAYDKAKKINALKTVLRNKHGLWIQYSEKSLEDLNYVGRFGHASSILGMRYDKPSKKCEFLIRNSYGNFGQRGYDKKLVTKYANGNVWVDEDVIQKIVGHMAFIF